MRAREEAQASAAAPSLLRVATDLAAMTRPRIGVFVVLSAFAGALLAAGPEGALGRALEAALLVGAVASASSVFNQVLERDTDRLMARTAGRPLPTGRLSVRDAVLFGALLAAVGTAGLALRFDLLAALLALATLLAYVLVYTPLKRVSSFNTVAGAIPGAMPPLIGHVALAGEPGPWGWMLFAVVFAWQFPHFLAIAWLYRADYARAGMRMLPALPGGEASSGRQALMYALLLLPVSLLPGVRGEAGILYSAAALFLGLAYAAAAGLFAWRTTRRTARLLLLVSLAYLPLLLSSVLFDPVVSQALASFHP